MFTGRQRPPFLPFLLGGLFLGLVFVALISAPRVVDVRPSPDAQDISPSASIVIDFNQSMNTASVETRLKIDPFEGGNFIWDGNRLIIVPTEPWDTGEVVNVSLGAGAGSRRLLPTLWNKTWSFQVGSPRLAYLWPASEAANIYTTSVESEGDPRQLTFSELGVLDFSTSSYRNTIAYTSNLPEGESEIRILDLITMEDRTLYVCDPSARCQTPIISPDGDWLAFEHHKQEKGSGGKAITRGKEVWLISLVDGSISGPVYDDSHELLNPQWSSSGDLTVFDNTLKAFVVLDPSFSSDALHFIPSSLGQIGSWSSDGEEFVYAEIIFPEEVLGSEAAETIPEGESLFFSHLYVNNLLTGEVRDISPGPSIMVEDSSPKYSPGGNKVAFVRKYLDADRWTLGRQVWLLDLSADEARRLTEDDVGNFSSLDWSSDGRNLAFMRSELTSATSDPVIWIWDVENETPMKFIEGGYLPRWIP